MAAFTSILLAASAVAGAVQAEKARKDAKKAAKKQEEELARLEAEGPMATPTTEGAAKRIKQRSSRRKTVVTGDLAPTTTGKKTLLG